ncbi:hypothetical protein MN608_00429 [Microdochium nivale]|nr:hypothetical protein MN608_00429 [Microdochium nivale]
MPIILPVGEDARYGGVFNVIRISSEIITVLGTEIVSSRDSPCRAPVQRDNLREYAARWRHSKASPMATRLFHHFSNGLHIMDLRYVVQVTPTTNCVALYGARSADMPI